MTLDEIHEWVFSDLGLCGCGDPEGVLDFLKSVLLAIRKRSHENREIKGSSAESSDRWKRNSEVIEDLVGMKFAPAMAWFFLYTLSDKDLLEHGGNCSGSWLTEKGEQILDALLKYDSDSIMQGVEDDILRSGCY